MLGQISPVILVGAPLDVSAVSSLFELHRFLFRESAGDLAAQIQHGDAGDVVEDIVFDVIVEGLFGDAEFRVICNDLERGLSLPEERFDDGGHVPGLGGSQVDAEPGINEGGEVIMVSLLRGVSELVEAAGAPGRAAVTGARGAVTAGAAERGKLRAVLGAVSSKDAFAVSRAFEREAAFMGEDAVEFDFFADSGLVLTDGSGDSRLGGAIGNAGEDDASFLKCKV